MIPDQPKPVKLFCGALYSEASFFERGLVELEKSFGPRDFLSPEFAFTASDYYRAELGWPITRRFVAFADLINPGRLAAIKLLTNKMEATLAVSGARKINIDPGYMDFNKVVLASAKANARKIYLNHGIYADPTLWFEKGKFTPYAWAFPDFKNGEYDATFLQIRALYKSK